MSWFCSVCVLLISLLWPGLTLPTPATLQPMGPATATATATPGDVNCSCVLQLHHADPTTQALENSTMASRELNPQFYEATRAGRVIQHHLNTLHGSPFRVYTVTQVHKARTEDMGEEGTRFVVEFSVKDWVNEGSEGQSSAEVVYPRGDAQRPPQVQNSSAGVLQANTSVKEQAFYQRYSTAGSMLSAKHIPDSYGHIDPEMKPFWHLAWVAASFIMLNVSSENTLYSLAQVARVTQLKSEDDRLRFEFEVLLHDMVSQEIIRWKLLVSWSPADGVKVSETELLPRCQCKSDAHSMIGRSAVQSQS